MNILENVFEKHELHACLWCLSDAKSSQDMHVPSFRGKKKRKSGNIIPPAKTINKEKVKKKINSDLN